MTADKRSARRISVRATLRRAVRIAASRQAGPRLVLTRDASRRLDQRCTADFAIPSLILMEHASIGIASLTLAVTRSASAAVLVLSGPGNNGGDGLACARHLHNVGLTRLSIVLVADRDRLSPDAAANLAMAERLGLRIVLAPTSPATALRREAARLRRPLLIIDALLGTGLSRPAEGPLLEAILACNDLRAADAAILAVDTPSGLDPDTGRPPPGGACITADATVTMAALKPGFTARSTPTTGPVCVVPIGAPTALLRTLGRKQPTATPVTARR